MKFDIIESRLSQFDLNSRDEYNNIPESNRMDQFINNLINDKSLDAYNYNNYLKYAIDVNSFLYMVDGCKEDEVWKAYYSIFEEWETTNEKLVDAFFDEDIIGKWNKRNSVFIFAGTGRGKNTFIRNQIVPLQSREKIIMFVNRSTLFKQQKKIMDNRVTKTEDDIIGEFVSNGMVNITENLLLVSYQKAALSILHENEKFLEYLSEARYAIFDEIHYVLDDACFNKGVNIIKEKLLKRNKWEKPVLKNATKIFMSATMEEMLVIFRKLDYNFSNSSYLRFVHNKTVVKWLLEKYGEPLNYFLKLPTDYNYIRPRKYTELELLVDEIAKNKEKWLIFVNSKKEGAKLCKEINERLGEKEALFINADNKESAVFDEIIQKEKFENRVLIATSVIYNGINISDVKLKNIVLPFTTVPMVKQMIGRKRVMNDETVNVYIKDVTIDEVEKCFKEKLKDYMKMMEVDRLKGKNALAYLNGLKDVKESFIYAESDEGKIRFRRNEMADYKLHFDTIFLLYLLKKMTKQHSTYVKEILIHLGVKRKYRRIRKNTVRNEKEKREYARQQLDSYLRYNIGEIEDTCVNGVYVEIRKFNRRIDKIYKLLYNEHIHSQFNNEDRCIPAKYINAFIDELGLPYKVTNQRQKPHSMKRKITIEVK